MSSEAPVMISDRGEDFQIFVDLANDHIIRVTCVDSAGAIAYIPRLTPSEARRLSEAIERAATRADARN